MFTQILEFLAVNFHNPISRSRPTSLSKQTVHKLTEDERKNVIRWS